MINKKKQTQEFPSLTLSWRRPNQSTDLLYKSMDWFLCDRGLLYERVNSLDFFVTFEYIQ